MSAERAPEKQEIDLGDPVEKYLPQLSNRQVVIGGTADQPKLEAASHPFTVRELMTHTAGFIYGGGTDAVSELWKRANIWQAKSLNEFVDRLARLPLAHDPGTKFEYSVSIDVLGALVDGLTLYEIHRERVDCLWPRQYPCQAILGH